MGDFVPENPLEHSLVAAAGDPAARPDFYRRLLESELFFVTPSPPEQEGRRTIEQETSVALVFLEGPQGPVVPFFSSRARAEAFAASHRRQLGFLGLAGADAFRVLSQESNTAVLNPGLSYGKEFLVEEIRRLAAGDVGGAEESLAEEDTQVLLSQPAVYPDELVLALRTRFAKDAAVEAAYLAQIHNPKDGLPAHPIIGILSSNYAASVRDAGIVVNEVVGNRFPVDIVEIDPSSTDGIDGFLRRQTEPFYERGKGERGPGDGG
jgi:SseB protein C-terminal domain/SseB protein N-terminal domain